jgi:hypothetical protein
MRVIRLGLTRYLEDWRRKDMTRLEFLSSLRYLRTISPPAYSKSGVQLPRKQEKCLSRDRRQGGQPKWKEGPRVSEKEIPHCC